MATDADIQNLALKFRAFEKERKANDVPVFKNEAEREEFEQIMVRADKVFQASAKILPPPGDETPSEYRIRLLRSLKSETPFRGAEILQAIRATGLDNAEEVVYQAAMRTAKNGPLRPIKTVDKTGREILEFIGRKSDWMRPLQGPAFVSAIYEDGVPQRIPYLPT